jgi:hypothetical protein
MEVEAFPDEGVVHFLDGSATKVHPGVTVRRDGPWFHLEAFAFVVIADAEVAIIQELL